MDMILLDWTRMGKSYCLAGAVLEGDSVRIVRPLLVKNRDAPVRNAGWSAYLLDGHARWELFELVGLQPALDESPHLEDVWVRTLRPRGRSAPPRQRRKILEATAAWPGEPVFGTILQLTSSSAWLAPGQGSRSLATFLVPSDRIVFSASRREGAGEADVRMGLRVPPLNERLLPLKDHHLLRKAEKAAKSPTELTQALSQLVSQMGEQVAVRLGLSRPFASGAGQGPRCWLMVDGLFSLSDPQA